MIIKNNLCMNEIYKGIKFNEIQLNNNLVSDALLTDIKKWCKLFYQYGFAPPYPGGSSGNLSIRSPRHPGHFIITCSYTDLGNNLKADDFAEVFECIPDTLSIKYSGIRRPSSESFLHNLIYENRPEIEAVFHGHSKLIMDKAILKGFPVTERKAEYGTLDLAESITPLINNPIIILKDHGFLSLAKNCEIAGNQILNL
jgi:hypothetical protein